MRINTPFLAGAIVIAFAVAVVISWLTWSTAPAAAEDDRPMAITEWLASNDPTECKCALETEFLRSTARLAIAQTRFAHRQQDVLRVASYAFFVVGGLLVAGVIVERRRAVAGGRVS